MKKKRILFILFFSICLLFCINDVQAACYKKCTNPVPKDYECPYVSECVSGGSISCERVSSSFCTSKVSCGNVTDIPAKIPELTTFAVSVIQIAVPIVLIIMGSLDLFKGITAQKEDEIKKGQKIFIKRLVYAAIIFFVIIIVKFVISIVADATTTGNIVDCIDCFLVDDNKCGR